MKLKKIMLLVTLLFVTSATALMAEASLEGYFCVDGEWVKGTAYGKSITIKDGVAYLEPPCALVLGGENNGTSSSDSTLSYGYRRKFENEKKAVSFLDIIKESATNIKCSDGLFVQSDVPADVFIYDLSGALVYSVANKKNIKIEKNSLVDGNYFLKVVDSKGNISNYNFMLSNGSMYINSSK